MARVGEVYRGLSIIEQAPLDGYKAPPSPLSFKLLLVVLWRIILFAEFFRFIARHSGVSNPSLGLSCRVFRYSKVTFVVYLMVAGAFYSLASIYLYFI